MTPNKIPVSKTLLISDGLSTFYNIKFKSSQNEVELNHKYNSTKPSLSLIRLELNIRRVQIKAEHISANYYLTDVQTVV